MISDIKLFLKYLVRVTFEEIKSVFKDVAHVRPRTMVYFFGILFIITWVIGQRGLSLFFLISCISALIYKYYVGGEWKHAVRQEYLKKAKEQIENDTKKK